MASSHRIVFGDSRKMNEVGDRSVHLIVTSPPYWQLKDYGGEGQIGFDDTYEDYINHMNLVWKECGRVLENGCRLCINIGDQFARKACYGRYKVIPIRTEIIRFLETTGFDYMGAVIWQKVTTCNSSGGGSVMGSYPYPRNGIVKIDYEFILIFKKLGQTPPPDPESKKRSRMTKEEWNTCFNGHWTFPGDKQDGHLAVFPQELPLRLIRMFSFDGETVLDPFLGSGTTTLAARKLGRSSIGYEINPEFRRIMEKKLGVVQGGLFEDSGVEFVEGGPAATCFNDDLKRLPYLFRDTVPVDRKADPRQMKHGSRVDSSSDTAREKYFQVKSVISPEKVDLKSGEEIKLIGVREKPEKREQAMRFLREKLSGQKVYLREDKAVRGKGKGKAAPRYLYLSNRTFVNRHLVRSGFVDVDISIEYRFRKKFIELLRCAEDESAGST